MRLLGCLWWPSCCPCCCSCRIPRPGTNNMSENMSEYVKISWIECKIMQEERWETWHTQFCEGLFQHPPFSQWTHAHHKKPTVGRRRWCMVTMVLFCFCFAFFLVKASTYQAPSAWSFKDLKSPNMRLCFACLLLQAELGWRWGIFAKSSQVASKAPIILQHF